MAARYRSGYLVPGGVGALSHAEGLATGEPLHPEYIPIPNLFLHLSVDGALVERGPVSRGNLHWAIQALPKRNLWHPTFG